jgi:hypothetical protein
MAFWFFIAAIIVSGIWYDLRKKAEQQKTIRTIVESGKDLDEKIIESILATEKEDPAKTAGDLRLAALITGSAGVGLAIFGLFLGFVDEKAVMALVGIGALVGCIGGGLWLASEMKRKESES